MSFSVFHNSLSVRKAIRVNPEPQMIITLSFAPALVPTYLLKVHSFIQQVFIEPLLCVNPQASLFTRYCPFSHGANNLIREMDVNLINTKTN